MASTKKPRRKRISKAELERLKRGIRRDEWKQLRIQEEEERKRKQQGQSAAFLRELRRKNGLGEFSAAAKRRGRAGKTATVRAGCKRGPYKGYTRKTPTAPGISGGC